MEEVKFGLGRIIPFPLGSLRKSTLSPELKKLIQEDDDVRNFYHFVHTNNLRKEALEILERELDGLDA